MIRPRLGTENASSAGISQARRLENERLGRKNVDDIVEQRYLPFRFWHNRSVFQKRSQCRSSSKDLLLNWTQCLHRRRTAYHILTSVYMPLVPPPTRPPRSPPRGESYVECPLELGCQRRLEHLKVVPFSRCSTGLLALLRDQVAIRSTMTAPPSLPSLPCLSPFFPIPPSLTSSALSKLSFFFLTINDIQRYFAVTPAALRKEDGSSAHPLCSQVMTLRPSIQTSIGTKRHPIAVCGILPGSVRRNLQ